MNLMPPLQSGYRQGHSTETDVLRVLSDILRADDNGDLAALVLLDLSAAFDTVDHSILLRRLHQTFGINEKNHLVCFFRRCGRTSNVLYRDVSPRCVSCV